MVMFDQPVAISARPINILRIGHPPHGPLPAMAQWLGEGLARELHAPDIDGAGEGLEALLHRENIEDVDILALHLATGVDDVLATFAFHRYRTGLLHCAHPAWPGAEREAAGRRLRAEGYDVSPVSVGLLAVWPAIGRATAFMTVDTEADPIAALWRLVRLEPGNDSLWQRLVAAETARGSLHFALRAVARWQIARGPRDAACIGMAAEQYVRLQERGELAEAERLVAALAAIRPSHLALQRAALGCNLALGQPRRARRFAEAVVALLPDDPTAHLALADEHAATGHAAAELRSRCVVALSSEDGVSALRRIFDAHRAASLLLAHPMNAERQDALAALAGMAERVAPDPGADAGTRHWMMHYRSLVAAAAPSLLQFDETELPPDAPAALCDSAGRAQSVTRLRRRAAWRAAELIFLVAADEHYLRLYGRAYLTSILAKADVPAMVWVHVIGGAARLGDLAREVGINDARIVYAGCNFDADAITTCCHDSDGPRSQPVAHFQCIRFVVAHNLLADVGRPVFVSDIDVVLQRGVASLLTRHQDHDVVLNRNASSASFGSHFTANLLFLRPSAAGIAFAAGLRRYLEAALSAPDVTRWIDQCGLQMVWSRSASAGQTQFGWFDTGSDINNVMYPRWVPNPFRFLSLFHGFDMASLAEMGPHAAA